MPRMPANLANLANLANVELPQQEQGQWVSLGSAYGVFSR